MSRIRLGITAVVVLVQLGGAMAADDCFVECDMAFQAGIERCSQPDETGQVPDFDVCFREVEQAHYECIEACDEIVDPPCDVQCAAQLELRLERCATLEAPDEAAECQATAESDFAGCVQACGGDPEDPCEECHLAFDAEIVACHELGNDEEVHECEQRVHEELESCMVECGPEEGRCFRDCDIALQAALEACVEEADGPIDPNGEIVDGDVDGECQQAAFDAYNSCIDLCLPEEARCVRGCERTYSDGFTECHQLDDPAAREACRAEVEEAAISCMRECGVGEEELCFRSCELAFTGNLEGCLSGDAQDPECEHLAHLEMEVCLLDCDPNVPDDARCLTSCDLAFQAALSDCDSDECYQAAHEQYEACIRACGVDVPDVPPLDPCLSDCDRRYEEGVYRCHELDDPEVASECLTGVELEYLACLGDCGVDIPEPPEIPDVPCVEGCDEAFEKALTACINDEDGAPDDACFAAADNAYLICLATCGIEVPDDPDLPGPPQSGCAFECDAELLEGIAGCLGPDGQLDINCVVGLVVDFENCRSGCEDDAESNVLAALLRTAGAHDKFLRGDANLDLVLDLSDAIAILQQLFVGEGLTNCPDSADGNDDGEVDISDALAVLNHLFVGGPSLPPPLDAPGSDPTADLLGCRL